MTRNWNIFLFAIFALGTSSSYDVWNDVPCFEDYIPDECRPDKIKLLTVDAYDQCGPAYLKRVARNYFLGASGRRLTYKENKDAFSRIQIVPKMLRDVSINRLNSSAMGFPVDFPIGASPVGLQKLAHPDGEMATVNGLSSFQTILILSNFASTLIEDVGAEGRALHLWMQLYLFRDRRVTLDIVRRAEKSGFKAFVVTVDSPVHATLTCDARQGVLNVTDVKIVNIDESLIGNGDVSDPSATFADLTWLKTETKLPIIAKGILNGDDARRAVLAGASAILVSNHGGRQIDGAPATWVCGSLDNPLAVIQSDCNLADSSNVEDNALYKIPIDALPKVIAAVNKLHPRREVYLDGGVRSGNDVYKALARGAKMVFVGRPLIWGLALGGENGVKNMMTTLKNEFNQTMLMTGTSKPSDITGDTLQPIPNA